MRVYRSNKKTDPGEEIPNEEIVAGFLASPWNNKEMRLLRSLNGYLNAPPESDGLGLGWEPGDLNFDKILEAILDAWRAARETKA
jgi:hypothetical protein